MVHPCKLSSVLFEMIMKELLETNYSLICSDYVTRVPQSFPLSPSRLQPPISSLPTLAVVHMALTSGITPETAYRKAILFLTRHPDFAIHQPEKK